ncbi:olfactory receptor 6N1-like [Pseudophryne corroboree]|uniref:olfactory receptor 6N1-like n=1 Tax=Pseudophryne corroboree TaxID=495146 RepID=UPI0030814A42
MTSSPDTGEVRKPGSKVLDKFDVNTRGTVNDSCLKVNSLEEAYTVEWTSNVENVRTVHGYIEVKAVYTKDTDFTNLTTNLVKEFIIFGFPSLQGYNVPLFYIFLFIYLSTVTGNGLILLLVILDQRLHTPMYFFVGNLAFMDMSSATVTIPKMLSKFSMHLDIISFMGCFLQMYFFVCLLAVECLLLSMMAYDRYLAICSPLHYHNIMTRQLYILLTTLSWLLGFASPIAMIVLALKLPFCGPNVIHHYYCDHPPILQLACADTSLNVTVGSSVSAFLLLSCFILIVTSYFKIIKSVLQICSSNGRRKTFSTCASHFTVVNMYFLPLIFMYIRPTPSYSSDIDSLVAMFYTVLTPMLNPVVYSLRNKDIKDSFIKQLHWISFRVGGKIQQGSETFIFSPQTYEKILMNKEDCSRQEPAFL